MRFGIFGIVISALFLMGALFYQNQKSYNGRYTKFTKQKMEQLKRQFLILNKPSQIIHLEHTAQFQIDPELINPSSNLPHTHEYPYSQIINLYKGIETCIWTPNYRNLEPGILKARLWHQFECDPSRKLPQKFFIVPPYLHPSGSSYAYLAYQSGIRSLKTRQWLHKYRNYFHLLELSQISKNIPLSRQQSLLANFTSAEIEHMILGTPFLLSKKHLMFKIENKMSTTQLLLPSYALYDRAMWETWLLYTPFQTREYIADTQTVLEEGNLSWILNDRYVKYQEQRYWLCMIGSILMLIISSLSMFFVQLKRKIADQSERTFILQTLTHELRTPVATMQMSLEPFRCQFDNMNDNSQLAFLRMCDGVQRLLKVIEASKNYLSLDSAGKKVKFDYQSVASVNDYFYDVLLHKLEDIEYIELAEDTYFCIDFYWLGMCVQNIVENALKHGKKPIRVKLCNKSDLIEIEIEDQGTISKEALSQLTNPFARASSKEGMGLGLSLVKKVITQMGGKIRFKNNPTRVTLTVRKRQ
ncbi:MAG: hypothetical protein COB02_07655 [Candidatus Cloacimonadota bacterium]|nr:MAG: hypothetical protein COB02_07655 [Candidatus Cloacimonadota bacterium]